MRAAPLAALLTLPAMLLAAGCDAGHHPVGNRTDGGFSLNTSTGADGEVNGNAGGFEAKLKLPGMKIDADDFDMNGVGLYPGSTIRQLNVTGDAKGKTGNGGVVTVHFDAPAAPEVVAGWFEKQLGGAGFTLTRSGTALTGKTDEQKPFNLELIPGTAGQSKGTIVIDG